MAVLRTKLLIALPLAALTVISTYLLYAGVPPPLRQLVSHSPTRTKGGEAGSSGIAYFLPVADFTDGKWVRMNTLLNKATKVCDKPTLAKVDKKKAEDLMCDITLDTKDGWWNLCLKTRAMFDHLCTLDDYGVGNNEFLVKIDDDTIADPDVEQEIMSTMSGKDVFFGFSPGFISEMTGPHSWFGGPFYGFSTSLLKQVCACSRPECRHEMGEDQYTGFMLGECNITKQDVLLPKGFIYHRKYSVPRLTIQFNRL
ncbi:hypothetical protein H4R19_006178 [Coemansia spiralis]|nr:hypothetical protein H4R19_006178 [Coemansia spiralis]